MAVSYTAVVDVDGEGRNGGHVRSSDGLLETGLALPKELGGAGTATNSEQLLAAGWAACFLGAAPRAAPRPPARFGSPAPPSPPRSPSPTATTASSPSPRFSTLFSVVSTRPPPRSSRTPSTRSARTPRPRATTSRSSSTSASPPDLSLPSTAGPVFPLHGTRHPLSRTHTADRRARAGHGFHDAHTRTDRPATSFGSPPCLRRGAVPSRGRLRGPGLAKGHPGVELGGGRSAVGVRPAGLELHLTGGTTRKARSAPDRAAPVTSLRRKRQWCRPMMTVTRSVPRSRASN